MGRYQRYARAAQAPAEFHPVADQVDASPGSVTLQSFLLDVEWSTCDMATPPGNGEAGELTFVTVPTDRGVGSRGTFYVSVTAGGRPLGGVTALLGMLTSCASNVSVVNIDNGFGAAYVATLINRL